MGIRHWIGIIVVIVAVFRRFFIVLGGLSHRFFLMVRVWVSLLPWLSQPTGLLKRTVLGIPIMLMVCRYRLALLAAFVLAFYADCSSQTGLAKPFLLNRPC